MKTYTFTEMLNYELDGINIYFPDLLGCLSCADTKEEAIYMAIDVLVLYLKDMKDVDIPKPTEYSDIIINENEEKYLITVDV